MDFDYNAIVKVGLGRIEKSPFLHKYSNDKLVNGVYANRLFPISWGDNPEQGYRTLRSKSVLFDCPHRPIEISGPESLVFLEKILTRSMSDLKIGKARYSLACQADGGILMDGVVMRLSDSCFWFAKADGEFDRWLEAHSMGFNVNLRDPHSRVLQIQGPTSLDVLKKLTGGMLDESFGYYNVDWFQIGGQKLLVSRSGFTGELGYEIYTNGDATSCDKLWDFIVSVGKEYGLTTLPLQVMDIRRIESGIRNNRTDLDETMTPYQAGLGEFVELNKADFIGRDALLNSPRDCLLFGFKSIDKKVTEEVADFDFLARKSFENATISFAEEVIGRVTAIAYSPYLKSLIGNVRLSKVGNWYEKKVLMLFNGDDKMVVQLCDLPFYDKEKLIPRGLDKKIYIS